MLYLYIVAAILLRVLPHPWNMTPMGAMFLFSGATFRNKALSLIVPLAALLVSDYLVVRFVYHSFYNWLMTSSWPAFALVGLTGWWLRGRIKWWRVGAASLAGSIIFFFASNFSLWLTGALFPLTWAGLTKCFVDAIPYFQNTAVGDLAYAVIFFGSYELVRRYTRGREPVVTQ